MYHNSLVIPLTIGLTILQAINPGSGSVQEAFLDVESLTLQDNLSNLSECSKVVGENHPLLSYCQNNSICRLLDNRNGYLHVICDCSSTITDTHYYTGPRCETKISINYRSNVSGLLNTCWLEDLFGLNSWKNDFTRVGSLY